MILLQFSIAMGLLLLPIDQCIGWWRTYLPFALAWLVLKSVVSYILPRLRGTWPSDDLSDALIGHPDTYLLTSVVLVTLALVIGYAASYRHLSLCDPASFNEPLTTIDAVYFALTTLTTVGYGDIAPRSQVARIIVSSQLISTIVFAILVIGGVVGILGQNAQTRHKARQTEPRDRRGELD